MGFRSAIPGVRLTLTLTLTPMPGPGNGGPREWGAGTSYGGPSPNDLRRHLFRFVSWSVAERY